MLRVVPIHFIFENNVGERRIRHETTLKRRHYRQFLDPNFPSDYP